VLPRHSNMSHTPSSYSVIFKKLPNFSMVAIPWSSYFSISLPTLAISGFFTPLLNYSHPSGCDMVSYCGFDLHFPND
jgi:hypothetical protein